METNSKDEQTYGWTQQGCKDSQLFIGTYNSEKINFEKKNRRVKNNMSCYMNPIDICVYKYYLLIIIQVQHGTVMQQSE